LSHRQPDRPQYLSVRTVDRHVSRILGKLGVWTRYLREWTAANHVRSAAGIAAAALLIVALYVA
jgi:uncharacterized membrane protein